MIKDILKIKEICKSFPMDKKLLLVPSLNMQGQIVKALNDSGLNPVNLHIKTIGITAFEIIEEYAIKNGLMLLDSNSQVDIIRDILIELKEQDKLKYFDRLENTNGLNKVIATTVKEIKFGGYYHNTVDLSLVKDKNKRADIELIIKNYDEVLQKNNFLDSADVVDKAIELFDNEKFNFKAVLALESCDFLYTEKLLLKKMNCDESNINFEELLHYENYSKQLKNVEFKKCYGDVCEVKEVLRSIIVNNIPFDEVEIIGLETDPYTQILYENFCTYTHDNKETGYIKELPITFGSGLPLSLSSAAKLVLLILNWISGGYTAHDFVSIFASGTIEIIDINGDNSGEGIQDGFGRMNIINAIKSSDLKWQRSTYLPTLKRYKKDIEAKISDQSKPANSIVRRLNAVNWIIELLENILFPNLPQSDENGKTDVDSLISGLKTVINKCVKIISPIDTQGLNKVNEELNTVIKGRKVPIEEAAAIISEHIANIRILSESPMPAKIHFSTYRGAEWINRKYTFIIGMDVSRFPCVAIQNPIVLDEERGDTMSESYESIENNICAMSRFLESLNENVTVSYSYFNTSEDRENYPSTIYNSLVENVSHNNGIAEYDFWRNNIKTVNIALQSGESYIDETDCIISESVKEFETESNTEISNDIFSVEADKGIELIDPRESQKFISASALATYFECPYRYYLQYVLGIKQINSKELDTLGWLSYFETGHLYHEIFEEFENDIIKDSGILENNSKAINHIEKIAKQKIEKYEKELPVASEYHTERQKQEIHENIQKFAAEEVTNRENSKPLALEFEFGLKEPCCIKLPSGKQFFITGFVDRIDLLKDNSIKIIDYKTGSTFGYEMLEDKSSILNAKSVQPILYFLALKSLSRKAKSKEEKILGNIKEAQYYFVTAKGDYEKYTIKFDSRSEEIYLEAFDELFDTMTKENFVPVTNNCNFCPYYAACKNAGGR